MTRPPDLFDFEDDYPVIRLPPVATRTVVLNITAIEHPSPQFETFEVEDTTEMVK